MNVSDIWQLEDDDPRLVSEADALNSPICSSVANGTLCCDRSSIRSDVCKLKGDIRTDSGSSSIFLYTNTEFSDYVPSISDDGHGNEILHHEKIRPYTRKWETNMMMEKVSELDLIVKKGNSTSNTKNQHHKCDVNHEVPAVFFSTGGYTGNVYHDINDGILPLYITSQHFNRKVVFVILDYHEWWLTEYGDVLGLMRAEEKEGKLMLKKSKPSLAIISRKGSREITNENALVKMAEEIGFSVTVLRPEKTTELAKMYRVLNSSDVMIGVHGAAMTNFLFMKPDSIFVQIIPLGLDWPSENYYGEPSRRLGLKYIRYKILRISITNIHKLVKHELLTYPH
ncbi:OLC1v1036786C1 [Oldenlandia corymbosa var. corymbosa]|uniref:OLC1v1036786C1 n=1 Tax=Oldenlandia corymbosa var. corymbosa TaxID=529605 RepID=A0AAV1CZC8_OLDCO|nr:OLC1v1036786C1 [Oldenlandia corymbosa var. corymbosa]